MVYPGRASATGHHRSRDTTYSLDQLTGLPKKNGRLRLCLNPQDLNKAIQREHYPLPTIEEIATRLHGAKLFTTLDVRHGHLML